MIPLTDVCGGQRFVVLGLAKTGLATAQALRAAGATVTAWDDAPARRAAAVAAGVPVADPAGVDFQGLAGLLLSPGIPHTFPQPHPVAARARAAGAPIIGDIELLLRADAGATFVAITGTNGKSTTTALTGHILKSAGRPAEVGGNLGQPVLTFTPLGAVQGTHVVEMSSYQLELTPSLRPRVGVLLNIAPDHLDRHGGMEGYIAAKARMFARQEAGDVAVIGVDDAVCATLARTVAERRNGPRVIPVSVTGPVTGGVYAAEGRLWDALEPGVAARPVLTLAEAPALPGPHNAQNMAAAYAVCRALGLEPATIIAAIRTFPGLDHRQQRVRESRGVLYVNDSKATNADATARALACYDSLYWILGGRAKESGLDGLEPFLPRIRTAFLIGEATERFAVWLAARGVDYRRCGDLATAVAAAAAAAEAAAAEAVAAGDGTAGVCVLLSPACASFDQFSGFEERGARFAALVREWDGGAA